MKTVLTIPLFFFLCTLLCSCPYSSPYKLDDNPSIYVEDALLGDWLAFIKKPHTEQEEKVKLTLGKKTDTEYNIAFTGYLDALKPFNVIQKDSVTGSGFLSTVGNRQFMNISIKSKVYIAELRFIDNKLSLLPLVEHFTSKMVQNNAALRTCVDFHFRTRVHAMYDKDFCLMNMEKVN